MYSAATRADNGARGAVQFVIAARRGMARLGQGGSQRAAAVLVALRLAGAMAIVRLRRVGSTGRAIRPSAHPPPRLSRRQDIRPRYAQWTAEYTFERYRVDRKSVV